MAVHSLTRRRAAPHHAHGVLRVVSAWLSTTLGGLPPWLPSESNRALPWSACVRGLYAMRLLGPRGWSLTDESREIRLTTETLQPKAVQVLSRLFSAESGAAGAAR